MAEDIPKESLYFDASIVSTLDPMGQYQASKMASYTATLDFIETRKPHFSVVTIHPVFVYGRNLLQTKPDQISGTNANLFQSLLSEEPSPAPFQGVHVDDVAEAHIRALSLADKPVASYLLSARQRSWDEVSEFAQRKYPQASFKTKPKSAPGWDVQTGRAERELGMSSWKEMETQVSDVVDQQLGLRGDSS